jgi:uncharacterized membrane protein YjjB (DUF3815 family)
MVAPPARRRHGASVRHDASRKRLRRQEAWIGVTALVAAVIALPLAPSAHSPEVASVLAVSAVALLAGHRWAIALVVISELLLLPGLWPRLLVQPPDVPARIAIAAACLSIVPGVLAMRRASAALIVITGVRRTRRSCRAASFALGLCFVAGALLPIV